MIDSAPNGGFDPASAGERLRRARERRGLSLTDLAARTRIDQRFLRGIEDADYTGFPARLFAVGFARNYARALGEPADPVAAEARARFAAA